MRRKNKKTMLLVLGALVLMISVGYALLSANLSINGTTRIANARWDVHFENVRPTANSTVTPTTAPSAPAVNKVTSLSYVVNLDAPGDVYEFLADVVNAGAIDAQLDSVTSTIKVGDGETLPATSANIPSYLVYSVTMGDGSAIVDDHTLLARATETYKVHVEFKMDITNEQLEAAQDKTITLTVNLNYVQAEGSSLYETDEFGTYVYTTFGIVEDNEPLDSSIDTYPTHALAMNSYIPIAGSKKPFSIKHLLNSNTVTNQVYYSAIMFTVTDEMAAEFPGMVAGTHEILGERCLPGGAGCGGSWEDAKDAMFAAFGSNNCTYMGTNGVTEGYECSVGSYNSGDTLIYGIVESDGFISITMGNNYIDADYETVDDTYYTCRIDGGLSGCAPLEDFEYGM